MKKNILIIILAFTTLFFFAYAFIKADEAEKAATEAQTQREIAKNAQAEAERQAQLALDNAAEAKRQQALAENAMAKYMECKDGK
ncbi:hypothetical protein [Ekhidna sp.]|jgi:Tfp pilus assembly protein PilO|uniref:hypothetical protein n=1 Tax=Ekhidna sp. TaxID=2608089 RepID=UPI0032F034AA